MPRSISKTNTKPEPNKFRCTICNNEKKETDFYKSNSILFKGTERICICKDCLIELYGDFVNKYNDTKKAIYKICEKLDIYFDDKLYDAVEQQAKAQGSILIQIYFQKVNSMKQYSGLTFDDSCVQNDIKNIKNADENMVNGSEESKVEYVSINSDFEVTTDMIIKWGKLPKEDLEFLDNNYYQWTTRHQCQSRAEEILFEEICQMQLDIKKTRETGGDTVKKVEALQKLMTSANIRPLDQNAINSAESTLMMGTIISTIEKNEPSEFFDEYRKQQYSDYMGYKKYFNNWVLRPLKNLMTGSKDFNIDNMEDIQNLEAGDE